MSRQTVKKVSEKIGLQPGALIHVGKQRVDKVRIRIIDYDETHLEERDIAVVEECFSFKLNPTVTWINVEGLHDIGIIERIGKHFDLHPLLLEDILNTEQRPKTEDYGNYIFFVLKMIYFSEKSSEIEIEQVSVVLGQNFVISFQEGIEGDVFNSVRERIRAKKGHIRSAGADYLAYALMDAVVDNYFVILEKFGEIIEELEEELVTNTTQATLKKVYKLRREMIILRKSVWPLREVVTACERGGSPLIHESTITYLRDLHDHVIQAIDTTETFREMISGMLEIYLSSNSNRMNEIIKVLTIITSIFIPLTFIAGIYGMNFDYMPELDDKWGYPAVLFLMLLVAISMVIYFRRKRWL